LFSITCLTRAADLSSAIPRASRQLVVVSTASWTASRATLERYERTASTESWQRVGVPIAVLIGQKGLAWGHGLHAIPAGAARIKREGDRCAPAGVFRITGAFGQLPPREAGTLRIPYRRVGAGWVAVDDPASHYYNRIVDQAQIARPDWRSAERLDAGSYYRLAIDLAHNPKHLPGAGSCIFLHEWTGHRTGTAGCTVLRARDLPRLACWLDARAEPVLLQAPRSVLPAAHQ
jgi:D-alanyl-D-alanine dipeptidase